jgi:hypothetical protein
MEEELTKETEKKKNTERVIENKSEIKVKKKKCGKKVREKRNDWKDLRRTSQRTWVKCCKGERIKYGENKNKIKE